MNFNLAAEVSGNAVTTITVQNLELAMREMSAQVLFIKNVQEVPGHVKMQMFQVPNGNCCQLVEKLD